MNNCSLALFCQRFGFRLVEVGPIQTLSLANHPCVYYYYYYYYKGYYHLTRLRFSATINFPLQVIL